MFDEPTDLSPRRVREVVRPQWGLDVTATTYAPLGFGSYHWFAERAPGERAWFVTADRLEPAGQRTADVLGTLQATAASTRSLVGQGLEFVLAGLPSLDGGLVASVDGAWALQVYPYVEGHSADFGEWTDPGQRRTIAELLGRLHRAEPPESLPRWEFAIPSRAALAEAYADLQRPWAFGPYGERARALLTERRGPIDRLFARYDELTAALELDPEPWVVSHCEPHAANVVRGNDGRMYLIDWDTLRLAPRERDLVNAFDDGKAEPAESIPRDALEAYRKIAGPDAAGTPRPEAVELFRLWWRLAEICAYTTYFRRPHGDGEDDRISWQGLEGYASET